jgi:hypothetical protein
MVSKGDLTAISAAATTATGTGCSTGTSVTADNVNNQSFTFANGGVFDTNLTNISTALAFSNQAQQFKLTSAGTLSGTATGTSNVSGGVCNLTVTTSTIAQGRKEAIRSG